MKVLSFSACICFIGIMAGILTPDAALGQNRLILEPAPPPKARLRLAAQPEGRGMIKFGTPQVYSRQVVFRDRAEEIQYLSDRLKEVKNLPATLQGIIDTRDYQALGIVMDLAKGTANPTLTDPAEGANGTTANRVKPAAPTVVEEPQVLKTGGAAAKTTSAVLTPIEQEKAVLEVRRFLQNERRRLNFDDMHDATGAVAVDLGILVTLIPPDGEDAYAVVEAHVMQPGHHEKEQLSRVLRTADGSGKAGYNEPKSILYEKVEKPLDQPIIEAWGDYLLSAIQAERDFLEMRVMSNALPFGERHFQLAVDELKRKADEQNEKDKAELARLMAASVEPTQEGVKAAQERLKAIEGELNLKEKHRQSAEEDLLNLQKKLGEVRQQVEEASKSASAALETVKNTVPNLPLPGRSLQDTLKALNESGPAMNKFKGLAIQSDMDIPWKEAQGVSETASLALEKAKDEVAKLAPTVAGREAASQSLNEAGPAVKKFAETLETLAKTNQDLEQKTAELEMNQAAEIQLKMEEEKKKEELAKAEAAAKEVERPVEQQLGLPQAASLTSTVMESSRVDPQIAPPSVTNDGTGTGKWDMSEQDKAEAEEEKRTLFFRLALKGGIPKLDLYKNKDNPATFLALLQKYKDRLMAQYLELYFEGLIPPGALESGSLGALKTRKPELVKLASLQLEKLKRQGSEAVRVLSVDPADQGQNISNVGATQSISDVVLSLSAILPESRASGRMDAYRDSRQFLQSANRKPVAVGFVNGDSEFPSFGWVLGPRFEVELKRPWYNPLFGRPKAQPGYSHEPTQHQVQVSLGMTAWMPGLDLELRAHWVNKRTGLPVTPILTSCHVPVKMTPDYAALTEGMLDMIHGRRRPPRILIADSRKLFTLSSQGTKHTLVLLGKDMWRSPSVSLDSLLADSVEVLPGLVGVVATFNGSLPPSYDSAYNLTITTTDGYDVIYNRVAAPVRGGQLGGGGTGAPSVRVTLSTPVLEVTGLADTKLLKVPVKVLENRFPMPAEVFLKGGLFPVGASEPVRAEIIGGSGGSVLLVLKADPTLAAVMPGLMLEGGKNGATRLGFSLGLPVMDANVGAPMMVNVIEGDRSVLIVDTVKSIFDFVGDGNFSLTAQRPELTLTFPPDMPPDLFAEAYPEFISAAARGEVKLRLKMNDTGVVLDCAMRGVTNNVAAGQTFYIPTLDQVLAAGRLLTTAEQSIVCMGKLEFTSGQKSFSLARPVTLKLPAKPASAGGQ